MTPEEFPTWLPLVIGLLAIWSIPWEAVALWKAARRKDIVWFVVLMLTNTIGILEILYIFVFSKNKEEK